MCLASHNNHPTSLASSWDISFLKSLVQQDPKGSNKVAHLFILDVYVSPNRIYVNLSTSYHNLDFSFFMSQDDAYFHIHQNDPHIDCDQNHLSGNLLLPSTGVKLWVVRFINPAHSPRYSSVLSLLHLQWSSFPNN